MVGAAHAVLAHAHLMRARPAGRWRSASRDCGSIPPRTTPSSASPCGCPGRRAVRRRRPGRGLLELQEAHAEVGATRCPSRWPRAALLEHRAALLLGLVRRRRNVHEPARRPRIRSAEVSLMRAWAEAAAGSPGAARATILPLLDGDLPPCRSTVVEAWLVEVWGALRTGDRPAAPAGPADRPAPGRAAGLPAAVRPRRPGCLGPAGRPARRRRDPTTFAVRCLTARQRVSRPRHRG